MFCTLNLQHSKQNKPNCVYGKVCKHMNKPGGIYVFVKFVEKIEDASADDKPQKQQQQCPPVKHPNKHANVVHRKQC